MNQHLLIGTSLDAAHSSRDQAAHDTTKQKDDEAEKTEHNGDEPEGELVTLAVDVKVPVLFQLFTETSGNTCGALALGLNAVHVCVEADASSVVTLHVITWISSW